MRFTATKTSAALAGIWASLGFTVADRVGWSNGPAFNTLASLLFFLVPVIVWVVGFDALRERLWRPRFSIRQNRQALRVALRKSRRHYPQVSLRMLIWFLGAALTAPFFSYLFFGRWLI